MLDYPFMLLMDAGMLRSDVGQGFKNCYLFDGWNDRRVCDAPDVDDSNPKMVEDGKSLCVSSRSVVDVEDSRGCDDDDDDAAAARLFWLIMHRPTSPFHRAPRRTLTSPSLCTMRRFAARRLRSNSRYVLRPGVAAFMWEVLDLL